MRLHCVTKCLRWNRTPSFSFSIRTFFRATFLPVCLCFALNTSLSGGDNQTTSLIIHVELLDRIFFSLESLTFWSFCTLRFEATGFAPSDATRLRRSAQSARSSEWERQNEDEGLGLLSPAWRLPTQMFLVLFWPSSRTWRTRRRREIQLRRSISTWWRPPGLACGEKQNTSASFSSFAWKRVAYF